MVGSGNHVFKIEVVGDFLTINQIIMSYIAFRNKPQKPAHFSLPDKHFIFFQHPVFCFRLKCVPGRFVKCCNGIKKGICSFKTFTFRFIHLVKIENLSWNYLTKIKKPFRVLVNLCINNLFMKTLISICRIMLGAIFLTFGMNGLFHFFPLPETTPEAENFQRALWNSGYLMYMVKTIESSAGLLLILNRWVPLALNMLLPIAINIFLVDTLLQPQHWMTGSLMFLLTIYLIFHYRLNFRSLLQSKTGL